MILGFAFDFNLVKPHIKELCDDLDEFILVPTRSPYLQVKELPAQIEVRCHTKTYVFPKEDTKLLPITNISTEELAQYFAHNLNERIRSLKGWTEMEVVIEETRGQSVSFSTPRA